MEIRVYSDIHQEFKQEYRFEIATLPNEKNQVLVLAGDIIRLKSLPNYIDFFEELNNRFKAVLYVFGNHEYYNFKIGYKYIDKINSQLIEYKNIYILSRYSLPVFIDNYLFIGATLWTSGKGYFNKNLSNDFKKITYYTNGRYSKFNPLFWKKEFESDFRYVSDNIDNNKNVVVITHHPPSEKNVDLDDVNKEYSAFYKNELDLFIERNPNIKLWIHGHIHNKNDFMVGDTRIFSNPIGYYNIVDNDSNRSLLSI